MIVADSSVWIAKLRLSRTPAVLRLDAIQPKTDILVGDLVLLEILQGARDAAHAARIADILQEFTAVEMMNKEIALAAASNYRKLRELGITVRKTIDLIIATFCIVERHWLLHDDRDFDGFEKHLGLRCL